MRTRVCCACVTVLFMCSAWAQKPEPKADANTKVAAGTPADKAEAELRDLLLAKVTAEWEATKNKDMEAYEKLLADDAVILPTDGNGTRNKLKGVFQLKETAVASYLLANFRVLPLCPDAAHVTYESTVTYPRWAQFRVSRLYISELWLKRDGQWKMRWYQETAVK